MARDHRKLKVFLLADGLVLEVYQCSQSFPTTERYALQNQIRRAAVSTVANIVEGSARLSTREYVSFLNIASGSATEACYLLSLAGRLDLLSEADASRLSGGYSELSRGLRAMIQALHDAPDLRQRLKP